MSVAMMWLWALASDASAQLRARAGRADTGSVTVEQAIITGVLVTLALGLSAVIGVAVAKYSGAIK